MRIGIDLGGTKTEIIAMDERGEELYRKRVATDRSSYQAITGMIASLVLEAERELKKTGTVGVGIPGTISAATGFVKNANTTVLNGNPLDKDLGVLLKREVRCMNDANCLAASEAIDGAGRGHNFVFAVILGTGCGSGIALNGRAYAGVNLVAGEWGHNPLPWMTDEELPGNTCWCGKRGCLETYISGTGFVQDYARLANAGHAERRGDEIVSLARVGDEHATLALNRYADRLARGLSHVINIMDPDIIVLGGGMSNVDELYELVPPLLKNYVFGGEASTKIVKNRHGDSSGVRGAAWLWEESK